MSCTYKLGKEAAVAVKEIAFFTQQTSVPYQVIRKLPAFKIPFIHDSNYKTANSFEKEIMT